MKRLWGRYLAAVLLAAAPAPAWAGGDAATLLAAIKAVKGEGAGNGEAGKAWRELVGLGIDALPATLAALDDADPVAANWLRAAADALAERELAAGRRLPADRLEAFIADTRHAPAGRRLAYEWLTRVDPKAPERLLPGMLQDPSVELRRDAVAVVLREAQGALDRGDKAAATAAFQKALAGARDRDQVDLIARRLKELGTPVDLAAHFGYLRRWHLVGPFDSTGGKGYAEVFEPEKGVDLKAAYKGKGGAELRWVEHTTADPYGLVDLNKALAEVKGAAAYAFAAVESPAERAVEVRATTKNAVKVFVNGRQVYAKEEYHHGKYPDQHVARVTLPKGRSTILIKVCQNEQTESWTREWDFHLRLCDAVGTAVPVAHADPQAPPAREEK